MLEAYKPPSTLSRKLFLLSYLRQRSRWSFLVQMECCSPTHLWILQAINYKAPRPVRPLRILQPPIRHRPLRLHQWDNVWVKTYSDWFRWEQTDQKEKFGLNWLFWLTLIWSVSFLHYSISTTWAWWMFWELHILTCNLPSRALLWPSLTWTPHTLMCDRLMLPISSLNQMPYPFKPPFLWHLRHKHVCQVQDPTTLSSVRLLHMCLQTSLPYRAQGKPPQQAAITPPGICPPLLMVQV